MSSLEDCGWAIKAEEVSSSESHFTYDVSLLVRCMIWLIEYSIKLFSQCKIHLGNSVEASFAGKLHDSCFLIEHLSEVELIFFASRHLSSSSLLSKRKEDHRCSFEESVALSLHYGLLSVTA